MTGIKEINTPKNNSAPVVQFWFRDVDHGENLVDFNDPVHPKTFSNDATSDQSRQLVSPDDASEIPSSVGHTHPAITTHSSEIPSFCWLL